MKSIKYGKIDRSREKCSTLEQKVRLVEINFQTWTNHPAVNRKINTQKRKRLEIKSDRVNQEARVEFSIFS